MPRGDSKDELGPRTILSVQELVPLDEPSWALQWE